MSLTISEFHRFHQTSTSSVYFFQLILDCCLWGNLCAFTLMQLSMYLLSILLTAMPWHPLSLSALKVLVLTKILCYLFWVGCFSAVCLLLLIWSPFVTLKPCVPHIHTSSLKSYISAINISSSLFFKHNPSVSTCWVCTYLSHHLQVLRQDQGIWDTDRNLSSRTTRLYFFRSSQEIIPTWHEEKNTDSPICPRHFC